MKKLTNYYTDYSQELLEVSRANMLKDFKEEQKAEKKELIIQGIIFAALGLVLIGLVFRGIAIQRSLLGI